jgi:methylated-DNA-[protein]-cysteine S-methyltransferase
MSTGSGTFFSTMDSPIGALMLTASERALTGLYFSQGKKARLKADPQWRPDERRFEQAKVQLQEYFSGRRRVFDLSLDPPATPFQSRVLTALQDIPYGQTRTYKEIAAAVGSPKAMRAVGNANGNNPLAIFIPCHRVVGSDGSLTGFGGGLDAKQFLLTLERQSPVLFR